MPGAGAAVRAGAGPDSQSRRPSGADGQVAVRDQPAALAGPVRNRRQSAEFAGRNSRHRAEVHRLPEIGRDPRRQRFHLQTAQRHGVGGLRARAGRGAGRSEDRGVGALRPGADSRSGGGPRVARDPGEDQGPHAYRHHQYARRAPRRGVRRRPAPAGFGNGPGRRPRRHCSPWRRSPIRRRSRCCRKRKARRRARSTPMPPRPICRPPTGWRNAAARRPRSPSTRRFTRLTIRAPCRQRPCAGWP